MTSFARPDFFVAVFCGARPGLRADYAADATALGAALADRQIGIVCGGSKTGLMGSVADGCLDAGGYVEGVLPPFLLAHELAHPRLSAQVHVDGMHARKARMVERAHAVVVLPGGLGTCDELFEVATWADLGMHGKPIWLLDTAGYFAPLTSWVEHIIQEGFAAPEALAFFAACASVAALADELDAFRRAPDELHVRLQAQR